jgi:hypothetical protein
MRTLDAVRALFPLGATVEVIENTYRPVLNGSTRRVIGMRKSSLDVELLSGHDTGKPGGFVMALPARAGDVLSLSDDTVTFRIGRGEHTCTFRVIS